VYYITSVLQLNVGLDRNLSLLLGGVINMMFFFGSLYPTFTLDKTGRRKPMMWGSFGCGFSMLMIAILLSFQMRGANDPVAKATASGSVAFFFTVRLPSPSSPFTPPFLSFLLNTKPDTRHSTCSRSAPPLTAYLGCTYTFSALIRLS
jgi:hypothetical protein